MPPPQKKAIWVKPLAFGQYGVTTRARVCKGVRAVCAVQRGPCPFLARGHGGAPPAPPPRAGAGALRSVPRSASGAAPPASHHLAKNGFEELRRGTSLQFVKTLKAKGSWRRVAGKRKGCPDGPRSALAKGNAERSWGWPTGCCLVASSFGGFDRSHLADVSPT
jgi:hypothetical protein